MSLTDNDIQIKNRPFKRQIIAGPQPGSLDQQNSSLNVASAGNDIWQSFTPSADSFLLSVSFKGTGVFTGVTLRIYEGEGTGGSLLATETGLTLNAALTNFELSSPPVQESGVVLTARLDASTLGLSYSNANPYAGGRSNINATSDFVFETYEGVVTEIVKDDSGYEFSADEVDYDGSVSGLAATDVQDAIDEAVADILFKLSFNTIDTKVEGHSIRTYGSSTVTKDSLNASSISTFANANLTDIETIFGTSITQWIINKLGLPVDMIISPNTDGHSIVSDSSNVEQAKLNAVGDGYHMFNWGIGTKDPNTKLDVQGGQTGKVTIVTTSTYIVTNADHWIAVDYTATGSCAITIPVSESVAGRDLIITDTGNGAGANNITVTAIGATIKGTPSIAIKADGDSAAIKCKSPTIWWVV